MNILNCFICVRRFLDGAEITPNSRVEAVSRDDVYALCVRDVGEDDVGVYSARATNKAGSCESKSKLIISGKFTVFELFFYMTSLSMGCLYFPSEEFFCSRRSYNLNANDLFIFNENDVIIVSIVCSDLEERKRSCMAQFLSKLSDVTVSEGSGLDLSCRIQGQPPPDVTWYFMGERVHNEGSFAMLDTATKAVLNVSNVSRENAGMYSCKIKV